MDAKSQEAFMTARASMQKTYIQCVSLFGGVSAMDQTDSQWLDAIDFRLAELVTRAGHDVPVILPTATAFVASLPQSSIDQLRSEKPTIGTAGQVPKDDTSASIAALAAATRLKSQTGSGQAPAGAGGQQDGNDTGEGQPNT